MRVTLKPAKLEDSEELLSMLFELGKSDGVSKIFTTKKDLSENIFSENPAAYSLFIYNDNNLVGFIIYSWKWATFTGRKEMYMQALFIKEKFRNKGIGKRAMSLLSKLALENGCTRIEWYAVKEKLMSKSFYDSIKSSELNHMVIRRISGKSLKNIANIYI